jgi:peptidoglycan-associated lipoprotein
MNRKLPGIVVAVLAPLLFAACSSTDTRDDAAAGEGAAVDVAGAAGGAEGATTAGASAGGAWTGNPVDNPDSLLYNKVIYFEFDSSEIGIEYHDIIRAHAQYLAGNPGTTITLEGHADERGTREYNIALAERRANAVRRLMEAEGVASQQINVISYGEERPADPGHNETAWTLNRRAVIVY